MNSYFRCLPVFLTAAVIFAIHLPVEDASAQRNRRRGGGGSGWEFVAKNYDADKDGSVTAKEYTRGAEAFKNLDNNGDGVLDKSDWEAGSRRGGGGQAPVAGDVAPDFSLTEIRDQSKTVALSDFAGNKPVALLFGSCT